jgi:hypothetical protein
MRSTSLREAVQHILKYTKEPWVPSKNGGMDRFRVMNPQLNMQAYLDTVRGRPIADVRVNLKKFENIPYLPAQSGALLSVLKNCNEGCIAARLDGNGRHALVIAGKDTPTDSVWNECVSWTLRGAHVSVLIRDEEGSDAFVPIGHTFDTFSLTHSMESDVENLLRGTDIVEDLTSELGCSVPGSVDIPKLFENLRLVRPNLESKLVFDCGEEPCFDLINFLDSKQAQILESIGNEVLEICESLRGEALEGRPVRLNIDTSKPLPDFIVSHALLAAINPFQKPVKDSVFLTGTNSFMHESTKRFIRFVENRLESFQITENLPDDDLYFDVGTNPKCPKSALRADSDPFRLSSEHIRIAEGNRLFRGKAYEVINCKLTTDDSLV